MHRNILKPMPTSVSWLATSNKPTSECVCNNTEPKCEVTLLWCGTQRTHLFPIPAPCASILHRQGTTMNRSLPRAPRFWAKPCLIKMQAWVGAPFHFKPRVRSCEGWLWKKQENIMCLTGFLICVCVCTIAQSRGIESATDLSNVSRQWMLWHPLCLRKTSSVRGLSYSSPD